MESAVGSAMIITFPPTGYPNQTRQVVGSVGNAMIITFPPTDTIGDASANAIHHQSRVYLWIKDMVSRMVNKVRETMTVATTAVFP